jgi:guanylate kinase
MSSNPPKLQLSDYPNGRLIIISGPSGAGKSTVVRRLIEQCQLPLALSVSATTRPPRPAEVDGRDYHFLTQDAFRERRERGEFLECKEVFSRGYWYGTLRETVSTGLKLGKWVILEIDVEGALTVFEQVSGVISIFVHPGSMDELERRLRARGTEDEETIHRRLTVAQSEMARRKHYSHEVVNETVDACVHTICQLLSQHQRVG